MTTTTVAPMTPAPTAAAPPRARRAWPYALIVPAVLFLAIAPTLTWLEFSSGSENLNVGTVLEMRRVDPVSGREGPWLVPTLKGAPRVIKPPLTAWVSAALVGPETVAALSHADPAARAAAYERLAWEVRWPALVLACASLAFVFELGRVLTGSVAGGVLAATVAGINLLFLRYGRSATTDVQLMLWVAVANACFAKAWFERRPWVGAVGGGVALGLALMSKGPVALVQTIVPVAVAWAAARWWLGTRVQTDPSVDVVGAGRARFAWGPLIVGSALVLAVATPWYFYVWYDNPAIVRAWVTEVSREGATDLPADPWYGYFVLPVLMLPWTAYFVAGLVATARDGTRGNAKALAAAALLVVPVVVMSFFRDKPDRYLLPLAGAAGVVSAWAMLGQLRPRAARDEADRALAVVHGVVLVLTAVLPLGGALSAPQWQLPWYGWNVAAPVAAAGLAVAVAGFLLARRWGGGAIVATVGVMVLVQFAFLHGYRDTLSGRSEMRLVADRVWQLVPDADVFYVRPERPKPIPLDLNIYTNRVATEVDDLAKVRLRRRPGTRPQAAVFVQRTDRAEPPPTAPPDWTPAGTFAWGDRRTWHLFVRRPEPSVQ